MPVDDPAGQWPEQAGQQQRRRENPEEPGAGQMKVRRHRIGEHRR